MTVWLEAGNTVFPAPVSSSGSNSAGAFFDNITLVPEPTSLAVLGLGAMAALCRRRRA